MDKFRAMIAEGVALLEGADVQDALLKVANLWRKWVRGEGDAFLEAISKLRDAAQDTVDSKNEIEHSRALADLKSAVTKVQNLSTSAYRTYADGRDFLYVAFKDWGLPVKRTGGAKQSPSADLGPMSEAQLLAQIKNIAIGFVKDMKGSLDMGARAVTGVLAQAKNDAEATRKELWTTGMDFRDSTSVLFGRTEGILRRAQELVNRSWARKTFEATDIRWKAPWADDLDIGPGEVV